MGFFDSFKTGVGDFFGGVGDFIGDITGAALGAARRSFRFFNPRASFLRFNRACSTRAADPALALSGEAAVLRCPAARWFRSLKVSR